MTHEVESIRFDALYIRSPNLNNLTETAVRSSKFASILLVFFHFLVKDSLIILRSDQTPLDNVEKDYCGEHSLKARFVQKHRARLDTEFVLVKNIALRKIMD